MSTTTTPRRRSTAQSAYRAVTSPTITAIVRNQDGDSVEITESAAYDTHTDFMTYAMRCVAAGYRVEIYRD